MIRDDNLFTQPPSNGTATSNAAARDIRPVAKTLRREVLAYIAARPDGCTDEQVQVGLNMPGSTQRPRRGELVAAGLVRDSGRTRRTVGGREAIVWVAVDGGAE